MHSVRFEKYQLETCGKLIFWCNGGEESIVVGIWNPEFESTASNCLAYLSLSIKAMFSLIRHQGDILDDKQAVDIHICADAFRICDKLAEYALTKCRVKIKISASQLGHWNRAVIFMMVRSRI